MFDKDDRIEPLRMPPPDSEQSRWFAAEVLPHEASLRSWLRARFAAVPDIDDVVQETYARLLRAHATGPIACVRGFLFVTARNLALNHLRHRRVERPHDAAEVDPIAVPDAGDAIADSLTKKDDLHVLMRAIEALPERCRQVMTLRKIYGLSQLEVAARLGISENTVEAQAAIGLRKCVDYFRRHGYGRDLRA